MRLGRWGYSMNEPVGDLCVLLADDGQTWVVAICRGNRTRDELARFPNREEASEFVLAERDRRLSQHGVALDVHFPDDCPCIYNLAPARKRAGDAKK
jgi:hypothetical protein